MQSQSISKIQAHHDKIANKGSSQTKVHFLEEELDFIYYFAQKIKEIQQITKTRANQNIAKEENRNERIVFYEDLVNKIKRKIDKQSDNLEKQIVYTQSAIHILNDSYDSKFQQNNIYQSYETKANELNDKLIQSEENVQKGEEIRRQIEKMRKAQNRPSQYFSVKHKNGFDKAQEFISVKNKIQQRLKQQLILVSQIKEQRQKKKFHASAQILALCKVKDYPYKSYHFLEKEAIHYRNRSVDYKNLVSDITFINYHDRYNRQKSYINPFILNIQNLVFNKQINQLKIKNAQYEKKNNLLKLAIQNKQNEKLLKEIQQNDGINRQDMVMKQIMRYEIFCRYYHQKFSACNLKWLDNSDNRVDNKYYLNPTALRIKQWFYYPTQPFLKIRNRRIVKSLNKQINKKTNSFKKIQSSIGHINSSKGKQAISQKKEQQIINESQPQTMCSVQKSKSYN